MDTMTITLAQVYAGLCKPPCFVCTDGQGGLEMRSEPGWFWDASSLQWQKDKD